MEEVGRPAGIKDKHLQDRLLQSLRDQAERAKRTLSRQEAAELKVRWRDQELSWTVSQERFTSLAEPLLERLMTPVERALRDARIRAGELDEMVLVGGATRMPMVRRLVARMFGRLPAGYLNPDEVVALGAAVQAGLKARDAALDEVVITDVCPYTLGTEVVREVARDHYQEGLYLPIIERNTVIPASRVQRVYTISDNQRQVLVNVFQGEARKVKENILLGKICVPVRPALAGEEAIDIRFTYDINGLLEVEATVASTANTHCLVIEQNPGVLSPQEIERRLAALAELKIHPRDQAENRALLARAERLYEESLGELRAFLAEAITAFEGTLERQDPEAIAQARERLAATLNESEGDPFL